MAKSLDYDSIPREQWGYYLYLEGMAKELMHVIQQRRKDLKLDLMDWVDLAIVQEPLTKLTSAIYCFADEIADRCRVKLFSSKPIMVEGTRLWKEALEDAFHKTHSYDLYLRKHESSESVS